MNKESSILETAVACGIGAVQARRLIVEATTRTNTKPRPKTAKEGTVSKKKLAAVGAIGALGGALAAKHKDIVDTVRNKMIEREMARRRHEDAEKTYEAWKSDVEALQKAGEAAASAVKKAGEEAAEVGKSIWNKIYDWWDKHGIANQMNSTSTNKHEFSDAGIYNVAGQKNE